MEISNAAFESLDRMRNESKKSTLKLVDMECSYLTVDFFRKLPQDVEKGGNPTNSIFDRYKDSYLRRISKFSSSPQRSSHLFGYLQPYRLLISLHKRLSGLTGHIL